MKKVLGTFSLLLLLTYCTPTEYDYCEDVDIFINGRFSHTETQCGYYYDYYGGKETGDIGELDSGTTTSTTSIKS